MNTTSRMIEEASQQVQHFKFSDAENSFRNALEQDPTAIAGQIGLARILLLKNETAEGLNILNQALTTQPENSEALALKAVVSMMQKDWTNALSLLERARQREPGLAMVHINLAHCYRMSEETDKAESSARRAVQLAPRNYEAHAELGRILVKTKRVNEGLREFHRSLRLNPFNITGYFMLGKLYQAAGKTDLAIKILKRGIKWNPMALNLRESLAASYIFNRQLENAYEQTVFVALVRNTEQDWLKVGVAAVAAGKPDKALNAFKKVLEFSPFNWEANYNLGELYFAAKLYSKARKHYELAILNAESDYRPCNGLGLLLLTAGNNPVQARDCFALALERDATRKEPMLNLALACAALNDHVAAEKFARAASLLSLPGDGTYEQAERLIQASPKL
jgi:tetratricopeptide (TPR) repeat protein